MCYGIGECVICGRRIIGDDNHQKGSAGVPFAAWLNDAKGKRQEEAPPSIVTDHLGFRGQKAIRNWGSCVGLGRSLLRRLHGGPDVGARKVSNQIELEGK